MEVYKQFRNPSTGEILSIVYDVCPESPRTWGGNVGRFLVRDNCKYIDNESDVSLNFSDRNGDAAALDKNPDVIAYLPVYVYDHSGACMNTTGFSCPWDSGQIGWIVCTRESLRGAWISWARITEERRKVIMDMLRGEVEVYNSFMSGEVYGYELYAANPEGDRDDDMIDEGYGYYGDAGIKDILKEYPEFTEEIA